MCSLYCQFWQCLRIYKKMIWKNNSNFQSNFTNFIVSRISSRCNVRTPPDFLNGERNTLKPLLSFTTMGSPSDEGMVVRAINKLNAIFVDYCGSLKELCVENQRNMEKPGLDRLKSLCLSYIGMDELKEVWLRKSGFSGFSRFFWDFIRIFWDYIRQDGNCEVFPWFFHGSHQLCSTEPISRFQEIFFLFFLLSVFKNLITWFFVV